MTEKRNKDDHSFFATNVILELEGVVLQNNFEEEEVFPFVRQKLEEHLDQNWSEKSFHEIIQILREEAKLDEEQKVEGFVGIPEGEEEDVKKAVLKNLLWQMDRKKTTEGFKKIQKQIFEHGNFKIKLCENVDTRLKTWKDDGKNIFILSSYNLDEQKLLLANTEKGDLLPIFSDLYSADVGQKNEKETYSNILGKLTCSANDVMFISNKIENAESASSAGIVAALISKDGSTQQDTAITYVNSLSDIEFENVSKKRKLSKEPVEISGSSHDQKLSRPDISTESDVEMMDVSENGIVKEEEESAEKLKNELGDIKEIESKQLVVKSDTTKGVDDSVKSGNDKTSADAKNKPNQEKSMDIEPEVEDEPKGNVIIRDENKKIAEETTSNGLQSSSIVSETLEGESVCKTEIKPLTEEIKTDKNVENLDKEETNLNTEVSIEPEIKDHENQMSAQSEKEKLVKVDKPSEQNQIIDNSNFPVGLNSVETDKMPANPKNENLVPEKEDKPSKKLEEISLSSEIDTDKTNPLKSDVDNPSEDIPKAIEDKVVDELCPSEIKGTAEVVNNVILLAKEHLQEYNTNNMECDDSKTTDDKDKPIDEHSLSSENKTQGINIDTVKAKLESSEVKIVEVPSSSDSNIESMCTEVEDNQSTSIVKTQPEKISAVKDTDISESNIDMTQKSIAKTEVEDKMGEESSSTEMKSANVDVDTPTTEEVNPLEDKGVNAAQSLESNSVCSDTKTKKLEMDTPSEKNGVENPSGQNGVNMKDETENSSEEPVVAQNGIVENGKHINGVNEKLNVEDFQCSEKKVENGLTKGTEIEA